jgi:hypothetical protein
MAQNEQIFCIFRERPFASPHLALFEHSRLSGILQCTVISDIIRGVLVSKRYENDVRVHSEGFCVHAALSSTLPKQHC